MLIVNKIFYNYFNMILILKIIQVMIMIKLMMILLMKIIFYKIILIKNNKKLTILLKNLKMIK